jgi:hypothetical protein
VISPKSRIQSWKDVTFAEMYVFFALALLMPLVKKHAIQDYWSNDCLTKTDIFGKYMSRDRFLLILRCLHFADNTQPKPNDPLWKINYVFSYLKNRFACVFRPFQKLVVDESLVLFKGRLGFKQYIPSKQHRFGIKIFVLCDCETGIVLNMIVYTGLKTDIDRSSNLCVSGEVVKRLIGKYLGKGHILYTDNYYTSPALSKFLLDNETGSCGTVKSNRKNMPKFSTKIHRPDLETQTNGKVIAMKWRDKRDVNILSTIHQIGAVNAEKHYVLITASKIIIL